MENLQIDQVALAMSIIALIKEGVPAITGKIKTALVAVAVCVAVFFGAPHIPQELYTLIVAVAVPMGIWSGAKNLSERAGIKSLNGQGGSNGTN